MTVDQPRCHSPWCSQSVVLKALCIATRQPVILKQYFKKKMSSRAVHKMKREVRGGQPAWRRHAAGASGRQC